MGDDKRQSPEAELRELKWRVVANAGRLSERHAPRWSHVMDVTGFGSTEAARLCREAGFNPDMMIGGRDHG